ncbi:hypothetical protein [Polycyclovorans algicola]|uniref:hypothetical protein n=1 Tax=Polycyclovorans algicola TaxID=616992 RepID=UPI0004A741CF|nr:hypothetical protein [Polycyclovorans algicola]
MSHDDEGRIQRASAQASAIAIAIAAHNDAAAIFNTLQPQDRTALMAAMIIATSKLYLADAIDAQLGCLGEAIEEHGGCILAAAKEIANSISDMEGLLSN